LVDFLTRLEEKESKKNPIKIGLIGTGKMGRAIMHQAMMARGTKLVAVGEIDLPKARSELRKLGFSEARVKISEDSNVLSKAIEEDMIALTANASSLIETSQIDVIIDATGEVELGAKLGHYAMERKKNFVMMNAEADATIGPLLSKIARTIGVVYTGDLGDEPGTIMNYLYEPFKALGFEIVAAGKGKNNPLERYANPTTVSKDAEARGLSPAMLTSFVDGTKTMVEMTILSNATGLLPDTRGMHGPTARVEDLSRILREKRAGGIMERRGIVDYVIGVAPGVFAVVDTPDEEVRGNLEYLKVGHGPPYAFYRPYHLPGTETVLSAIWAVDHQRPIIQAIGHFSDTIAIAKRDLEKDHVLDGIGGYDCFSLIERSDIARQQGILPIGLTKGAKVTKPLKQGYPITFDDVELDEEQTVVRLWRVQQKTLA
jgi:predicted homoserine dehydrogenase-like protein